jgi:GT2 family glycosyltransferase
MEKICAVLVSRNRRSRIEEVVNSLVNQTFQFAKIIIVDNDSTDGTREYLEGFCNDKIHVICLSHNAGHGASIAVALGQIDLTSYDYIFFVEDDSAIGNDLVNQLLRVARCNPELGLLGSEGSIYSLGRKLSVRNVKKLTRVNFVLFSGLLAKTQVFKTIGSPRTNFFMMCDDLEFCMRAVRAGVNCGVIDLNLHEALHYGSSNSSRSGIWRSYYQSRNRILILRYHFSLHNLLDCIIWQLKFLYSAAINPFAFDRIKLRLLGIFHGIIGRDGFTVDPRYFK